MSGHTPPDKATAPKAPPKPRRTAAPKAVPKPVSVKVSYSLGLKVNLGNYESADFHVSETQEWDVTGISPAGVVEFADSTRAEIAVRLSDEATAKAILARGTEDDEGEITREIT